MTNEERINLIVEALIYMEMVVRQGSMGRLVPLEKIVDTLRDDLTARKIATAPTNLVAYVDAAAALAYEKWRAGAGNSIGWDSAAEDVKENWRKKVLREMQDRK